MKIKLEKLVSNKFQVREKLDKEHLESLVNSFKEDGQWHPIIVRPTDDGYYDIISGHYRYEAAKKLGWKEIEATIKDVDDTESRILALKTNLLDKTMTEIEEGKILKLIMEKDGLTQEEMGKRVGRSHAWVSMRISLVLDIHDDVKKAFTDGKLKASMVNVIGTLEKDLQPKFMNLIFLQNTKNPNDAKKIKLRWLNNSIYTIGFMGKRILEFINIINDNEIKTVIDVRYNTMSQYKADFSKDVLKRELERNNINYFHHQFFGVLPLMRDAVIDGYDSKCFRKWYRWFIIKNQKDNFVKFLDKVKDNGKSVLLCSESHSKPKGDQKHYCHRDFLVEIILEFSQKNKDETYHFINRVDL